MVFVSRNPKTILHPETADGCIALRPENMAGGQEFIGFLKNVYVDNSYDKPNNCYVFKGRDDGKDYLVFGCKSMHEEMAAYVIGDLVSITYGGVWVNKGGKYAGKSSHIWKVKGETDWIPTPEFVQQLQQEVHYRRMEVQRLLASPTGVNTQRLIANANTQVTAVHPNQWAQNTNQITHQQPPIVTYGTPNIPTTQPFLNPYGTKPTDPFG